MFLYGPIDENIWAYFASAEHTVERSPAGVLHDERQVGLLQAHPQQAHDVLHHNLLKM